MNEVLNTIFSRAGIREYLDQPVEREKLLLLLHAGIAAPNAYNRQAWHFTAVTKQCLLDRIDRETFQQMVSNGTLESNSSYHPLHGAPALVILSSALDNPFAKQDCSCANQNIALAAVSLGLGTRYLDVPNFAFAGPEGSSLRQACHIPDGYGTVCFLSVGYPAEKTCPPTPKKADVIDLVE